MASLKVPFTCPKPPQGPSSPGHVKFYSDMQHLGNFSHKSCQSAHLFLVHFQVIIFKKHRRLPRRHTWVHSLASDPMLLSPPLDFSSWFVLHYSSTSSPQLHMDACVLWLSLQWLIFQLFFLLKVIIALKVCDSPMPDPLPSTERRGFHPQVSLSASSLMLE